MPPRPGGPPITKPNRATYPNCLSTFLQASVGRSTSYEIQSSQSNTAVLFLRVIPVRGEGSNAETADPGELPANRTAASLVLQGLRVQVVDDEPDARELLTIVLQQRGAEVRASATASEALEMLMQWEPDVLVSDIGMPGEDGYDLMRKVRTLKSVSGLIPALALTGYARPEDAARALESGYHMHLPKPVAPSELVAAVASLAMKILPV